MRKYMEMKEGEAGTIRHILLATIVRNIEN
jgi:hypothetical protein